MSSSQTHTGIVVGSPTDVSRIWSAAVVRYEASTNIKIESLAKPKSVDEILNNTKIGERSFLSHRHNGSRIDKFRTLVRNSLTPLELLGDIVTNATKSIFPPSEVIFAAVKYLISTANVISTDFDRIEEFFQELSSYLTRVKVWEHKLPGIPELEEAITEVFTSVLLLCGICTKYVQMKRFVKAFRALAGEDNELKSAFDYFHKAVQNEEAIVRNIVLAGVQDIKLETSAVHADIRSNSAVLERIDRRTNDIATGTDQIRNDLQNQETALERNKILAWLSSLDFRKKQRDTYTRHCNGTGNWFLDDHRFRGWFNSADTSTLWCSGIPGAGKTIMTSVAISHTEELTAHANVAIAYVYCDYADPKLQSEIELISSLTRQLAEQVHPLPQEVKLYRDNWAEKRTYPSPEDRIKLIKDIILHFNITYIFVDALDECPEQNRNNFLRMLRTLEPFVRFFITSRPNLELQTRFDKLVRIDIAASHSDIQMYLESEINTNRRMSLFTAKDTTLKASIIDTVCRTAEGMFLVAHFQMALLCRMSSPKKVRQSLDTLPTEIYSFYEEALARIEELLEEDREMAKKALAFIYCARRPLRLEELRHALSIETGDTELEDDAFPEMEIVFNISIGLIRLDEKSDTVVLVHYTLQEYLKNNTSKHFGQPHLDMAKTCLTYMSMDVFKHGACTVGEALEQRLQNFPFLDYASHHWGYHLARVQSDEPMNLLFDFLGDEQKIAAYLQVLYIPAHRFQGWHMCFPEQFGPLHVLASWGLDSALEKYLKDCTKVNCQDNGGASPLHLAARFGHLAVVQQLISHGANIDICTNSGETALYRAARNGHRSIVELLLERGADVSKKDGTGWTAFDWAVIGKFPELARMLLHKSGLDNINSGNALILAAEAGVEATVEMLLDTGADVNLEDDDGSTALAWAVPEGNEKVVRILLDHGANVNCRDVYGNTPLHWAVSYTEIAKLLLERGADVDASNGGGQTPLMLSAQDGKEAISRLLLKNKADVSMQNFEGCTALHAAALEGHEEICKLLLENGSDPNTKDKDGWTPLHTAALRQHYEITTLLLEKTKHGEKVLECVASQHEDASKRALWACMADAKFVRSDIVSGLGSAACAGEIERVLGILNSGVDIDRMESCGARPLALAVSGCHEAMVECLLAKGADVNKLERSGRSALHVAAQLNHHGMVALLVEKGADIDACLFSWTPMLLAARKKDWQMVDYLARNGANVNAEDYYGRRALHWFAQSHYWETLRLLADHGADIHAKDQWGRTPLMYAVEYRTAAGVKYMLSIDSDVESKTKDGSTSLHLASYLGDLEIARLLLQSGASKEARTRRGFRALHIAALFGHEELVDLLLGAGDNFETDIQKFGTNDEDEEDYGDIRDGCINDEDHDTSDDNLVLIALCVDRRTHQQLVEEGDEALSPHYWTQQLARGGEDTKLDS